MIGRILGIGAIAVFGILSLVLLMNINTIPRQAEAVSARWAQVENNYQRRLDLISNLVETVKGYVGHENATLTAVVEARAKASQFTVSKDIVNDPAALARFQAAQGTLGQALSRISMLTENYPNLKADTQFTMLQTEIAGTENRIAVARRDYISAVQTFNTTIKTFPNVLINAILYHETPRANFTAQEGASTAPRVQFNR